MRVLVTGGRDFEDYERLCRAMEFLPEPATVVIHGDCPTGADRLARKWAKARNIPAVAFPANWDGPCAEECKPGHRKPNKKGADYCPGAVPRRNQAMVDIRPDICVHFPGDRGTEDCVRRAEKAGIARVQG